MRELLDAHLDMVAIRRFEEEIQRLFLTGLVPGTTHLCNGQEAVPVGLNLAIRPEDMVAGVYRGHGHLLARGCGEFELAAEMLGREAGICGGRAGSLNVTDMSHNYIGSFAIIGGSVGAATGLAMALKGTGRVAVAAFGDGAANQAYFFECLNFAKVYDLPLLFSCENNLYMEYTPTDQVSAGPGICARAEALGVPAGTVDGMDVRAVKQAAVAAVERARSGEGPQLIEHLTYRFVGHSRTDPATYRRPGELEKWQERDPLKVSREALLGEFSVAAEEIDEAEAAVERRIADAFERAQGSPEPVPTTTEGGGQR
ncbi:MAG: thiamine pyrophosphate-dependent dehydrogenase E1 component subunit alpha [Solirubrobacterales bacterium]